MAKTAVICDADSILYTTSYTHREKSLEEAIIGMDNFINQIANTCNADGILLCLTKGPNIRHQYAKTKVYKGNRKYEDKPIYYDELRQHMVDTWGAWVQPGYEADDLIFIARTEYSKVYSRVILATNDKDCLQYPGVYLDYKKMMFLNIKEEQASKSFWTQMITGDSTDNISAIEGAGPKKAEKLLKDIDYKDYPQIVLKAYIERYGEKEGVERFYESYKLLKLLNSCEEAGLELSLVPEPIKVDYGFKDVSGGS